MSGSEWRWDFSWHRSARSSCFSRAVWFFMMKISFGPWLGFVDCRISMSDLCTLSYTLDDSSMHLMGLLYCRAWLWSTSALSVPGFSWLLFAGVRDVYLLPSLVVSVVDTSLQPMSSRTCLTRSSSWSAPSSGRPLMITLFLHLFFSAVYAVYLSI